MKDKIIFFILGSVVSSVTTFVVTKKVLGDKYEKQLRLDVDNRVNAELVKLKEEYKNEGKEEDEPEILVDASNPTQKPDLMEYYKDISKKHNYRNYSDYEMNKLEEDTGCRILPASEIPYGIEDEIIRYKYWADKYVTDEEDEPLSEKEIQNSCGFEFEDFFGKDPEEPDIVYVKKDNKYYEITMDARNFEDVAK